MSKHVIALPLRNGIRVLQVALTVGTNRFCGFRDVNSILQYPKC